MRSKIKKFEENLQRFNIIEPGKELYDTIKGSWNELYFKNNHPITLELACGGGEYTVGLSKLFPNRNFIGIDIKGDRIWKGSGKAIEENLENVAFLRTLIHHLDNFFAEDEVDEIWLTFPDPRPRKRDEKRRLTHPRFLDLYRRIMRPGGAFHLKTDNTPFFDFTLEQLETWKNNENLISTYDLYSSNLSGDEFQIKTKYEKIWTAKGENIKYLTFQMR